jgi:hypothetical protein
MCRATWALWAAWSGLGQPCRSRSAWRRQLLLGLGLLLGVEPGATTMPAAPRVTCRAPSRCIWTSKVSGAAQPSGAWRFS